MKNKILKLAKQGKIRSFHSLAGESFVIGDLHIVYTTYPTRASFLEIRYKDEAVEYLKGDSADSLGQALQEIEFEKSQKKKDRRRQEYKKLLENV